MTHAPSGLRSRLAKQVIVLSVVLVAVGLVVAFPLRNYLDQRAELGRQQLIEQQLSGQLADLEQQKSALDDPNYIAEQARKRLQYVRPGDTPYVVVAPQEKLPAGSPGTGTPPTRPWYATLWSSVSDPKAGPAR